MKTLFLIVLILVCGFSVSAQLVARLQLKEDIEGICDSKNVFALFPSMDGQEEATCGLTKKEILKRLNNEVTFLSDKPKYKDSGMIGLIINCEGDLLSVKMDNKTKNKELDQQIEAIFSDLGEWKPGKLDNKNVDSSLLFSFTIKKGKFVTD